VVRRAGAGCRCGFVNCIPVFIARDHFGYWPKRFQEAGVPIIGDGHQSQVGATIVHRVLTRLFANARAARSHLPAQLWRQHRLPQYAGARAAGVEEDLQDQRRDLAVDYELPADDVHVGPSDHVPWLLDRKWCYIRMEGTTFGNVPLNAEVKLEVWDSPNSAGVVIDAIRCCKIAMDRGIAGPLEGSVGVLHEIAADPVRGRCRARHGGGFHRRMSDCSTGSSTGSSGLRSC